MTSHAHHEEIIKHFHEEYSSLLEHSEQGIYVYLDDVHKLCNKKFAQMLGYASAEEWAQIKKPFAQTFVKDDSQHALVNAYGKAMEHAAGSSFPVTWKTKEGKNVPTQVILVPIAFEKHVLALHFIS